MGGSWLDWISHAIHARERTIHHTKSVAVSEQTVELASTGKSARPHTISNAIDFDNRQALGWDLREGRIQSAERAVPTHLGKSKATNLLSA
jgi:hypothetical protein